MSRARAVALKAATDVAARAASLLTLPLLTRLEGVGAYGRYALLSSVVTLIAPFATLGLSQAVVRFLSDEEDQLSRHEVAKLGFTVICTASALAAAITIAAPDLNDTFIRYRDGVALIRWGAALMIVASLELLFLELCRARGKLIRYSLLQLGQTVFTVGSTATALLMGGDLVTAFASITITRAIFLGGNAVAAGFVSRPSESESDSQARRRSLSRMIRFGFPVALSGIGLTVVSIGDRAVIAHFSSVSDVGRYAAIYTVVAAVTLATSPLFLPAFPEIVRSAATNHTSALLTTMKTFQRYLNLTAISVSFFVAAAAAPFVSVLSSGRIQVALVVVGPLAAGIFLDQWLGLNQYLLMARERTVFLQNAWLLAGAGNILINLILVPALGIVGAALSTLLTYLGLNLLLFWKARAEVRTLADVFLQGHALRTGAAGGLAAGATTPFWGEDVISLLTASAVYWAVFAALALALRAVDRYDVSALVGIFRRRSIQQPLPTWIESS